MNSTIAWPDKSLPVEVYCAPEVLTSLEMAATDGLLAMPRIGLGVGGLLLGRRVNQRIDILKAVAIPCSHAFGPSFVLTPDEIKASSGWRTWEAEAQPEPAAATENAADADCEVVGWYCSKTSSLKDGKLALTEYDQALFNALCPEPWQAVLLIRPSKGKLTTVVFGFRDPGRNGSGLLLGAQRELTRPLPLPEPEGITPLQPERLPEPATPIVQPAPVEMPAEEPVAAPTIAAAHPPARSSLFLTEEETREQELREQQLREQQLPEQEPREEEITAPADPVIPVEMATFGTLFGQPQTARPARKPRKWPLRVLIVIILLGVLAAAAYYSRDYWQPRPPVAMMGISDWTGRVSFMWNSEALLKQPQATLVIDDGPGPLHTIHLTQAATRAGVFQFDCRPGKVTATLLAEDVSDTITVTARAETYLPESGISK